MLVSDRDRNYIFYYTNKNSKDFMDLSRVYWRHKLSEVIEYLNKELLNPVVILFGSLSKAEVKIDSDIDLCIFSHKKRINLKDFEKKFKRKIQILFYNSFKDINNQELKNNIYNGYILNGRIKS